MAVTVTIRLVAKDPEVTLGVLREALPLTRKYKGNRYSHTFVNQDKPHEITLIQEWETRQDQEAYIAWRNQTGDLAQLVSTLALPPAVDYYQANAA